MEQVHETKTFKGKKVVTTVREYDVVVIAPSLEEVKKFFSERQESYVGAYIGNTNAPVNLLTEIITASNEKVSTDLKEYVITQ